MITLTYLIRKNREVKVLDSLGKMILTLGITLVFIGLLLMIGGKLGLGKLPGDILIRKGNVTFFFPIVSSIILSLILSLIFNLLRK
ncbi:MAG: DUF2905 domain-containing protein [Tissierellia bacterium]|nr:DUF2905 domain-containing protein [Tissierellia bacterium]